MHVLLNFFPRKIQKNCFKRGINHKCILVFPFQIEGCKSFLHVFRTNHKVSYFSWHDVVVILEKVVRKTIIKGNNGNQMCADNCKAKAIDLNCFYSEKCNQ